MELCILCPVHFMADLLNRVHIKAENISSTCSDVFSGTVPDIYPGVAFWLLQYSITPPHANVNTCPIPYALWVMEQVLNDVLHIPRDTTNGYSTPLLCTGKW